MAAEVDLAPRSFTRKSDARLWRLPVRPQDIYLAASMRAQAQAARFALQLIDAGFNVTSSWLRKDFSDRPAETNWRQFAEYEARWGATDLTDLQRSDTLVVLADEPSSHGGYNVELGFFLGAGRENVVVVGGDRPNVFFYADAVRWCPTIVGLVEWLLAKEHGEVERVDIFPRPVLGFINDGFRIDSLWRVDSMPPAPSDLAQIGTSSLPTPWLGGPVPPAPSDLAFDPVPSESPSATPIDSPIDLGVEEYPF
jgi:hypothetical protein